MKHGTKQENIPRHLTRVIADHLSNHDLTHHSSHSQQVTLDGNGLITAFIHYVLPLSITVASAHGVSGFRESAAADPGPVMPE
jgi:hypothetical protein